MKCDPSKFTTVQYSCPWRGAWCSASRGSPSLSTAPVCLHAGMMPTEYQTHTNHYKYLFQQIFLKILSFKPFTFKFERLLIEGARGLCKVCYKNKYHLKSYPQHPPSAIFVSIFKY